MIESTESIRVIPAVKRNYTVMRNYPEQRSDCLLRRTGRITMYDEGISFPSESFLAMADVARSAMLDAVSKPRSGKLEIG